VFGSHSHTVFRDKKEGNGKNENGTSSFPLDQHTDLVDKQLRAIVLLRPNGEVSISFYFFFFTFIFESYKYIPSFYKKVHNRYYIIIVIELQHFYCPTVVESNLMKINHQLTLKIHLTSILFLSSVQKTTT